ENASQFARRLHVSVPRWSNVEVGYPLSIDLANKIKLAVPGMSLDWLYHGDERALPIDMVTRLRAEAEKPNYLTHDQIASNKRDILHVASSRYRPREVIASLGALRHSRVPRTVTRADDHAVVVALKHGPDFWAGCSPDNQGIHAVEPSDLPSRQWTAQPSQGEVSTQR